MPELPEVEVLARHLRPLLRGKTIRAITIRRARVLRPTKPREFRRTLVGAQFHGLSRRGKYLLFELACKTGGSISLLGHLGMTGRFFLAPKSRQLPQHTAVNFDLGDCNLIYEDTRYFGRLTLDTSALRKLGPEPLGDEFTATRFAESLKRSRRAIKIKLLDQQIAAGIGNIYASEALFRARIPPGLAANELTLPQIRRLRLAIRAVLADAIKLGSTVPLNHDGGKSDGFFYFGREQGLPDYYSERLRVYDREARPCRKCGHPIKRITQAARSTFYCPHCQRA